MDQEELADKDEIILYDSDEIQAEIIENSEPQPQPEAAQPQPQPELPQPAPDLQHVPDDSQSGTAPFQFLPQFSHQAYPIFRFNQF